MIDTRKLKQLRKKAASIIFGWGALLGLILVCGCSQEKTKTVASKESTPKQEEHSGEQTPQNVEPPQKVEPAVSKPEPAPEKPAAVKFTIEELKQEFEKDWRTTVRKYRDRELEITGKVVSPSRINAIQQGYQIEMTEDGEPGIVNLTIVALWPVEKGNQNTRTLAPAQTLTVRGTYKYLHASDRNRWILRNAEIVSIEKNPALEFTVAELLEMIEKTPEGNAPPFLNQPIRLKGVIAKVPPTEEYLTEIWLKDFEAKKEVTSVKLIIPTPHFDQMYQLPLKPKDLVELNIFKEGQEAEFHLKPNGTPDEQDGTVFFTSYAYPAQWPDAWDKLLKKNSLQDEKQPNVPALPQIPSFP